MQGEASGALRLLGSPDQGERPLGRAHLRRRRIFRGGFRRRARRVQRHRATAAAERAAGVPAAGRDRRGRRLCGRPRSGRPAARGRHRRRGGGAAAARAGRDVADEAPRRGRGARRRASRSRWTAGQRGSGRPHERGRRHLQQPGGRDAEGREHDGADRGHPAFQYDSARYAADAGPGLPLEHPAAAGGGSHPPLHRPGPRRLDGRHRGVERPGPVQFGRKNG